MITFRVQKGVVAIAVGCIISIGFTLLSQWSSSRHSHAKKVKVSPGKHKKKVMNPPWAITKANDLKSPNISSDQRNELNQRRPPKEWNTVIFFPSQLPNRPKPFPQLKKYFEAAKVSIQVCMFVCSLQELSDIIHRKYLEGLVVLIITDFDAWTAHNNNGLRKLARHAIPVRLTMNGSLMHNKFAVIDEEVVLTGSLNWTKQGVSTNNENVAVTTDSRITTKYVKEFNILWMESRSVDATGDRY